VFLEKSGVSHIVIPCNTTHFFADKLQTEIKTPIINMIREVIKDLKETKGQGTKVGILATDGTVKLGIYQTEMERAGLVPIIPSEANQRRVMKIIYDGIKGGGKIEFKDFEEIENEMIAKGCEYVIMGCTELSCFMSIYNLSQDFYIDAMKALAMKTIIAAGKRIAAI
jgi:aspartate racemase